MKKHNKNIQSAQYFNNQAPISIEGQSKNSNNYIYTNEDSVQDKNDNLNQQPPQHYYNQQSAQQSQQNMQLNKQCTGKSQGSTICSQPSLNQMHPKEQYQTSYKSLLISSRESIRKKKTSLMKPGTAAAGSTSNNQGNGSITDRYNMNMSNGFQQNQQQSNQNRKLVSQNGPNKNYQVKNGYLSLNSRSQQFQQQQYGSQFVSSVKNSTSHQNDNKLSYDGMGLEDYFSQREEQHRASNNISQPMMQRTPIQYQPQTSSSSQMQNQLTKNRMQNLQNNFTSLQTNNNQNLSPTQQIPQQQQGFSNTNNELQNTQSLYNPVSNQSAAGNMYQSSIIQQQITDICQSYAQHDVQTLKNLLINLIQKEEELLKNLDSRCQGVKELAEMIYADIPLPQQTVSYQTQNQNTITTPNNNMVNSENQANQNYNNNFNIQNNTNEESEQPQVTQIQGINNNYNTLNGQPVNDLAKIRDALHALSISLISASQNEINLGLKQRELEKLNLDISQLRKQSQNYKEKTNDQQKVIEILQNRVKMFQEENNRMLIQMNIEKKTAQASNRKVVNLEKRVEFILENDINVNLNPNDKLRSTLNELLRENEALKRDLNHKNQDIDRLQGQVKKLNTHLQRVTKKMDNMRKNPLLTAQNSLQQNQTQQQSENKPTNTIFQKDDIELLKNFKIPVNLNYRIVSLRQDQSNMISDIMEMGSNAFAKHVLSLENSDQKKQLTNFVTQQLISYKDLSEKMNQIIYHVYVLTTMYSLKEVSIHISSYFPAIFNAERTNLWIVEKQSGIFQTYSEHGSGNIVTSRCLLNKGLICDSFALKTPINSKNTQHKPLLYRIDNESDDCDYVNSTLLMPIFCNSDRQQVKAILEVSNSFGDLFTFDEEYYAIILSYMITSVFNNILSQQLYDIDMKYSGMLFEVYEELSQQKSRFGFTQKVKMLIKQLFQIDNSIFYFVENKKLISYNKSNKAREEFSLEHGLAGVSVSEKKSYIIHDIRSSSYYNPLVDISSLLPIYALPLVNKKETAKEENNNHNHNHSATTNKYSQYEIKDTAEQVCGLIEVVLKSKLKSKLEKEAIIDVDEGYFGYDEPIAHILEKFSKLVMNAVLNNQFID